MKLCQGGTIPRLWDKSQNTDHYPKHKFITEQIWWLSPEMLVSIKYTTEDALSIITDRVHAIILLLDTYHSSAVECVRAINKTTATSTVGSLHYHISCLHCFLTVTYYAPQKMIRGYTVKKWLTLVHNKHSHIHCGSVKLVWLNFSNMCTEANQRN